MNEAKKAMERRNKEPLEWTYIFKGRGVDIGCGPDKLPFDDCVGFDLEQGDANVLHKYFPVDHFDYIHASQCLEHMHDPTDALANWLKVLKPGGYAVISIPDFVIYEQLQWPSVYNPDHKSTWSLHLPASPARIHINVPTWLAMNFRTMKVIRLNLIDTNYDYNLLGVTNPEMGMNKPIDQTFVSNAEAFIEFVLQKP